MQGVKYVLLIYVLLMYGVGLRPYALSGSVDRNFRHHAFPRPSLSRAVLACFLVAFSFAVVLVFFFRVVFHWLVFLQGFITIQCKLIT